MADIKFVLGVVPHNRKERAHLIAMLCDCLDTVANFRDEVIPAVLLFEQRNHLLGELERCNLPVAVGGGGCVQRRWLGWSVRTGAREMGHEWGKRDWFCSTKQNKSGAAPQRSQGERGEARRETGARGQHTESEARRRSAANVLQQPRTRRTSSMARRVFVPGGKKPVAIPSRKPKSMLKMLPSEEIITFPLWRSFTASMYVATDCAASDETKFVIARAFMLGSCLYCALK